MVSEEQERQIKIMMMRNIMLLMVLNFVLVCPCASQNNYIYNGGDAQGFSFSYAIMAVNNSIFAGNSEDGFDHETHASISQSWNGGIDDGWGYGMVKTTINEVYFGGTDDGMDYCYFQDALNGSLFFGGTDDGFSYQSVNSIMDGLVFEGGEGDGFAHSGISKLIWDGDLNSDWLMADNWNIPIVPTFSHSACIPSGVPNYPKLSGVLNISLKTDHSYICSELKILPEAVVKGIEGTRVVVNGRLIVLGDLLINSSGNLLLEGRENGIIQIGSGGSIRVEN